MSPRSSATERRFRIWLWRVLFLLVVSDSFYLVYIWPDWSRLANGPIPRSSFIQAYQEERAANPDWPVLSWQPIALAKMPRHLLRTVLVAEDSRFYEHEGFDLQAMREVLDSIWNGAGWCTAPVRFRNRQ
jgi:monofunctional biosynthetic peptidoglycan transglycosylase